MPEGSARPLVLSGRRRWEVVTQRPFSGPTRSRSLRDRLHASLGQELTVGGGELGS